MDLWYSIRDALIHGPKLNVNSLVIIYALSGVIGFSFIFILFGFIFIKCRKAFLLKRAKRVCTCNHEHAVHDIRKCTHITISEVKICSLCRHNPHSPGECEYMSAPTTIKKELPLTFRTETKRMKIGTRVIGKKQVPMKKIRYEEREIQETVPHYSTKTETVMERKMVSKTRPVVKKETYTVTIPINNWVVTADKMYTGGKNARWVSSTKVETKTRDIHTTEHYTEYSQVPIQKEIPITTYTTVTTKKMIPVGEYEEMHEEDITEDIYEDKQIQIPLPVQYYNETIPGKRCACNDSKATSMRDNRYNIQCACIWCMCEHCEVKRYPFCGHHFLAARLCFGIICIDMALFDALIFFIWAHFGFLYIGIAASALLPTGLLVYGLYKCKQKYFGRKEVYVLDYEYTPFN